MLPHILLGAFACGVSSLAAGLLAIRALRLDLNRGECLLIGYCLGSGIVSMLTLGLASIFLARKGVFLAISLAAVILLWRLLPWLRGLPSSAIGSIGVFHRVVFAAAWAVYGGIYFRHALAPELSADGMSYHLGLVNLWNHAHGVYRIVDMFAALPDGMEMLYLFAFSIGRHSAATLVHFSLLMVLPLLMVLYGIRFGLSGGATVLAAVFVFVTPLVGWDGTVAYNDVALAVILFAALYLLRLWRATRRTACLVASGLLAGFGFAIKYTACMMLLLLAGTVFWELRREGHARIAKALLIAGVAMAIAPLPYLVRNSVWFHNPIAFFGNAIFPNPYFHVSFERDFVRGQAHINGIEWKDLPRELTFGGPKLPGSLGPLYLLAPLALVGLFWARSRYLVIAALVVGCAYVENKAARFLIPVLPPLLLAMAHVLSRLPFARLAIGFLTLSQLVLCWPDLVRKIDTPKLEGPRLDEVTWDVALRTVPEETYLGSHAGGYEMARALEWRVPEGQTVFAISGGVPQSYTTHFILDHFRSADAEKARDLLYSGWVSALVPGARWTAVFPPVRAAEVRIVQTASSGPPWSISELRLWHRDKLVPVSRRWRADASPNPWDAGLMFDGLEATHWRSWLPLAPGMYVSARLDPADVVDRVEVNSNDGQWSSKMLAELRSDDGRWVQPVSTSWQAVRALGARKAAAQALKRWGIRYVVIQRNEANDRIFADAGLWGMHKLAQTKESALYFID